MALLCFAAGAAAEPPWQAADQIGADLAEAQTDVLFDDRDDRSVEQVERAAAPYLADARVTYLATGQELALAENWTRAIAQGRGPYVALLNDDDRWHPGFLGERVAALDAHPECGFAFAECVLIDEEGHPLVRAPYRFREGVLPREELAGIFTRENVVVPLQPRVPGRVRRLSNGKLEIVVDAADFEAWIAGLEAALASAG